MAQQMTQAGQLNRRVTFQQRQNTFDEFGNEIPGDWADIYTCAARLQPKFGGNAESVVASRLASQQPYNLIVRNCVATRAVRSDWQVVDALQAEDANGASPRVFDIKTIVNPDERNQWIEMLVVEGSSS